MKRFRTILGAGSLALIAAGVLGTSGAASAATSPFHGGHRAVAPSVKLFGPRLVMDAQGAGPGRQHQPVILWPKSNTDPGQKFRVLREGTVQDFTDIGLVSRAFNLHYGNDQAVQLEYRPYGASTDLCVGTWPGTPHAGNLLRLEPCGVGAWTVWAIHAPRHDSRPGHGLRPDQPGYERPGYVELISAATTTFSHPLVAEFPSNTVSPFDQPRPVLNVGTEQTFGRSGVSDLQLWTGIQPAIRQVPVVPAPDTTPAAPVVAAA